MAVVVRQIASADAHALADFYNGLTEGSKRTFHPLGMATTPEACDKIIGDNSAEGGTKLDLVAWDGDRMVGWGFLWSMDCEAPMFGLGVDDDHQGQGVGRMLMDEVLQHAAQRGICKVTLMVVQDNLIAQKMYERREFVRQEAFVGEDGLPYYRMVADLGGMTSDE